MQETESKMASLFISLLRLLKLELKYIYLSIFFYQLYSAGIIVLEHSELVDVDLHDAMEGDDVAIPEEGEENKSK